MFCVYFGLGLSRLILFAGLSGVHLCIRGELVGNSLISKPGIYQLVEKTKNVTGPLAYYYFIASIVHIGERVPSIAECPSISQAFVYVMFINIPLA